MMHGQLVVLLIVFSIGVCLAQNNIGAGTLYKLNVVADVWLEQSTVNYNSYPWLIVSKHVEFPKKCSLLRFEDIPSNCTTVNHAMMYLRILCLLK